MGCYDQAWKELGAIVAEQVHKAELDKFTQMGVYEYNAPTKGAIMSTRQYSERQLAQDQHGKR